MAWRSGSQSTSNIWLKRKRVSLMLEQALRVRQPVPPLAPQVARVERRQPRLGSPVIRRAWVVPPQGPQHQEVRPPHQQVQVRRLASGVVHLQRASLLLYLLLVQ